LAGVTAIKEKIMSVIAHIGERSYEFDTFEGLTKARAIYAHCTGSQNEFEEIMENEHVEFYIYGDNAS
jgi:hypothetical protein